MGVDLFSRRADRLDRPALVVGGSEGIGFEIAKHLIRMKVDTAIAGRRPEKLQSAARELGIPHDKAALSFDFVNFDASAAALTDWTSRTKGELNIFLCPGITLPGTADELCLDSAREMMDVNFFGYLVAIKSLWPILVKRGGGSLSVLASGFGVMGAPGYASYCASKFALVGFVDSLRHEGRRAGVTLHCVCPPAVNTPGFSRERALKNDRMLELELSTGFLEPEKVARAACRAVRKGSFLVRPGWKWRVVESLNRHFPHARSHILPKYA